MVVIAYAEIIAAKYRDTKIKYCYVKCLCIYFIRAAANLAHKLKIQFYNKLQNGHLTNAAPHCSSLPT